MSKTKKPKTDPKVLQMSKPNENSDPEVNVSTLSPPVDDRMALNPLPEERVSQVMSEE